MEELPADEIRLARRPVAGSPGAILQGKLENEYRRCQINTFGGGATEVLRDIVAQMGLGLPRATATR